MEILKTLNSWTHIISATLGLLIGAYLLLASKGGKTHKKLGVLYFYLMIINCLTSLLIYNAKGKWFFPHSFAVANLIVILPGYLITFQKQFKHWIKVHITSMIFSYYMLIGGAINEAFLRIEKLTILCKTSENGPQILGMTHFAAMILFLGILVYFLIKYWNGLKK